MSPLELETVLATRYGIRDHSVRPLAASWDESVYLVTRSDQSPWVLRMLDSARAREDGRVLAFLERTGYPAPRVVRPVTGETTIQLGPTSVLVTRFVEGASADFAPGTLHKLGERLGQLHVLHSEAEGNPLPPAAMLSQTDMTTALRSLQDVASMVPTALQGTYDRLLEAIHSIGDTSHLPQALIHNDAHPGNAIIVPDGAAVFIDWHGAGIGLPVVDLGFLLISSEIAPWWKPPLPPDDGRCRAIVQGYTRSHMPTEAELAWLTEAMRFRGLLFGAAHLVRAATQGLDGDPGTSWTWWWKRYEAAPALALRAREEFHRIRSQGPS